MSRFPSTIGATPIGLLHTLVSEHNLASNLDYSVKVSTVYVYVYYPNLLPRNSLPDDWPSLLMPVHWNLSFGIHFYFLRIPNMELQLLLYEIGS